MTEANMKRLYDFFIESGQEERAKEIAAIPRYSHFAKKEVPKPEEISKKGGK